MYPRFITLQANLYSIQPPTADCKAPYPKKDEVHTMVQWCHSLRLFHKSDQKEGDSQQDQSKGTLLCAWSDNYPMVANIAQSTDLPYVPNLLPFGKDQAPFFCSSPSEATTTISYGSIISQGAITLNGWNESVNTTEPSRTRFEG